jgi:septal ring factor EnvC (AmiA/AmiB activator)
MAQTAEIAALRSQVENLQRTSVALQGILAQHSNGHPGLGAGRESSTSEQQALSTVEASQKELDRRLSSLEGALLQSPEKAIALPLLRQQLSDIQEKNRGDEDHINGEINRLYGMMQWFLGLMITLIIGVGGLVVNSFRQSSERRHNQHLTATAVAANPADSSKPLPTPTDPS